MPRINDQSAAVTVQSEYALNRQVTGQTTCPVPTSRAEYARLLPGT
jgi:hypothetical protein